MFKTAAFTSLLVMLSSNVSSFAPCNNGPLRRRTTCPPSNSHRKINAVYMSSMAYDAGRDFYNILGLTSYATPKDIKSAFRKLAKKYHPDINKSDESTAIFQEVNRAYEVLRDPQMRMKYDMHGESGLGTSFASDSQANSSPFSDERFRSSRRRNGRRASSSAQEEDLGGYYDPFAHRKTTPRAARTPRGEQIPCDQPGGAFPNDSIFADHEVFDPFNAAGTGLRSEAARKSIPFDEFVKAKMESVGPPDFEDISGGQKSVPFDEFVKDRIKTDWFVAENGDTFDMHNNDYRRDFDPYFGVDREVVGCDQGAEFPFRGEDQLFKRTGPGPARKSADRDVPFDASPFAAGDFGGETEEVFVSASIYDSVREAPRPPPRAPSHTVIDNDGIHHVEHPRRKQRMMPKKSLVMEAGDLWKPVSPKLRP